MSTIFQRRRGHQDVRNEDSNDETMDEEAEHHNMIHHSSSLSSTGESIVPSPLSSQTLRRRKGKGVKRIRVGQHVLQFAAMVGLFPILLVSSAIVLYTASKLYTPPPRLPIPHVDISVPNMIDWPLIHIVNTRFMQEQGPLTTLGMARFHLFMTFCFPSMVKQSTQKFFWIIKTDPKFTTTPVFHLLLQAVRPHHNIYVVASNNNFLIDSTSRPGSWRDGVECMDLLQSKIYTGNVTRLRMAMALREERPVLETRLDADDGLHTNYIEYIQIMALRRFQPPFPTQTNGVDGSDEDPSDEGEADDGNRSVNRSVNPDVPQWLYWCTRRHLEWHSTLHEEALKDKFGDTSAGVLAPIQHDKLCITPGMTVGFNTGVDPKDVPVHSHDKLYLKVSNSTACYPSSSIDDTPRDWAPQVSVASNQEEEERAPCLDLVEDLLFCAVRSRTLTSAGMQNVGQIPSFQMKKEVIAKMWHLLHEKFGVDRDRVKKTQDFLLGHRKDIAYENILGQCTTGHSCKGQAKAELQRIIAEENQNTAAKDGS